MTADGGELTADDQRGLKMQVVGNDDLLSDEQAALVVGVRPRTIRDWRERRGLPFSSITRNVSRIRRSDLLAWIAEHRVSRNAAILIFQLSAFSFQLCRHIGGGQ